MKRLLAALLCLATLAAPAAAQAAHPSNGNFGLEEFDFYFGNEDGSAATAAGSHPWALTVSLAANTDAGGIPEGWLKDVFVRQIPGLVADTTAYDRCPNAQFLEVDAGLSNCPLGSQLGVNAVGVGSGPESQVWNTAPVFNLFPPPGVILRLGFSIGPANVTVDVTLNPEPPHNALASSRNVSQLVEVAANKLQIWGDPTDSSHDGLRGRCGVQGTAVEPGEQFEFTPDPGPCPEVSPNPKPFLTLPTECSGPLDTTYEAFSWEGERDAGFSRTHNEAGVPQPFTDCGSLSFDPALTAVPTSTAAHSPTGLDLSIAVDDPGLTSVSGRAKSHIQGVRIALPEGMRANPSLAEGLKTCSIADLGRESVSSAPGEGCPQASKIGTIEVQSPLVDQPARGALYVATPYDNLAGDSLIALYIVIRNKDLGLLVKQATRVEPDPDSGQLVGIAEDLPQLPFSSFALRFREGSRSPLITPPGCGRHTVKATFTPRSGAAPFPDSSAFEISSGPQGSPCPQGNPFEPGFEAGSLANAAGAHSPFLMRLTRRDGDQDLTRFDASLPPGVSARLAGVGRCSEAQIARARAKSGKAEQALPSCPAASQIGTVRAGAGVGSQLTYVGGAVHLAGPFGGAPLSAVAIVPAVAGPFDVGTVVYRQALKLDPRTGEVTADGAASDPLPRILAGIPLAVRDVQVSIDRPAFTLNPTSCDPFATTAQIRGSAGALATREARYQAASCQSLGFKPRLGIRLRGGTRRGAHPALRAVLRPRPGDANLSRTVVRLPRSAFLEQAHIRTICTRVQFAAGQGNGASCPKGAVYGRVRAFTPLLDQPLEGPAFLRSSNNKLPDLVFALRGIVDLEAVARIDSIRGGIRATFTKVPDAPISRVVVNMQGGKKGLIVNSRNLCRSKSRAEVRLLAHNARRRALRPLVRPRCARAKRARAGHSRAR